MWDGRPMIPRVALPFPLSLSLWAATGFLVIAAEPAEPRFRAVSIDSQVGIGYGVATGDVDGDGRVDVVLCDKNLVAWYRNPDWQKHVIVENLTRLDHVCIAVADIDGDGKVEIAAGAGWNPGDTVGSGAVFYLEPPADRTARWTPVALPHEPTVHRMRWVKDWQDQWTLVVVPLHGRGNKDGEGAGVRIQRYRRPVEKGGAWQVQTLDEHLHKTHNFDPVQWDEDVAHELLVGGREGLFLLNWSREKQANELEQLADGRGGGVGEVRVGRLGAARSGRERMVATIEPMHGHSLVVHTPPPQQGGLWDRRVLDETLVDGHALACGDILGLGRDQIVVGWRAMNRPGVKVGIKLFVPPEAAGGAWRSHLIDDNRMACEDLVLADFNADGRLDIVAAGRATKNLVIYFNEGRAKAP